MKVEKWAKNGQMVQNSQPLSPGAGAVTGVLEFMAPSFIQGWHSGEDSHQTKIGCQPLSKILEQSSLDIRNTIDLLSLDVEGAEFEVLKTILFDKIAFGVICYEADDHNPLKNNAMIGFLEEQGYAFREHTMGSNFHINLKWQHIYDAFL